MSDPSLPSLGTVAHGTRRAGGNEIARQITRGAGVALGVAEGLDGASVCVAAGSTDPVAWRDLRAASHLLADAWGTKVRTATLGGLGPRPETVLTPDDAVSPYLLSPGLFSRRLAEQCEALSVPCADVIGPHPLVVDLVVERYRDLAAEARATA